MSTRAQKIQEAVEKEITACIEKGDEIPNVMLVGPQDLKALIDEAKKTYQHSQLMTEEEQAEARAGIVGHYPSPTGHRLDIVSVPGLDSSVFMIGNIVDKYLVLRNCNGQ